MKLEKAIEILDLDVKCLTRINYDDWRTALKLGIEALKDLIRFDEIRGQQSRNLLPGETVD